MFPPSDQIIVWILWGVVGIAALVTLVSAVSLIFALLGAPDDIHDVPIDPDAPITPRKTTKK